MKQRISDILRSIALSFTMFSRVPMPRTDWKPEHMRYMLASFPLVGVVLGMVLAVWWMLCRWLSFDSIFFGAGVALLPVLFTGGIHLDGFCDTVDALKNTQAVYNFFSTLSFFIEFFLPHANRSSRPISQEEKLIISKTLFHNKKMKVRKVFISYTYLLKVHFFKKVFNDFFF